MCAILDANQAADFCNFKPSGHIDEFRKWMLAGGKIIIGEHLTVELMRISKMTPILREWERRGQLKIAQSNEIKADKIIIEKLIVSDDPHVVSLLRKSKADLLISDDKKLIVDAKNRNLIGRKIKVLRPTFENPSARKRAARLLASTDC